MFVFYDAQNIRVVMIDILSLDINVHCCKQTLAVDLTIKDKTYWI